MAPSLISAACEAAIDAMRSSSPKNARMLPYLPIPGQTLQRVPADRRRCGGGRIIRVHTKDVNYKGYVRHASKDDPQCGIKSDKTAHVALHKGKALRRLRR